MESERLCIRLDNPERIFYAGQVIRGEIWMNLNKRTKIRGKFELLLLLYLISQASWVSQARAQSVMVSSDFCSLSSLVSLWPHWHKQRRCLTTTTTKVKSTIAAILRLVVALELCVIFRLEIL